MQLSAFGARDGTDPPGSLKGRAKELIQRQRGGQLTSGCPAPLVGIHSHLQLRLVGSLLIAGVGRAQWVCSQSPVCNSPAIPAPGKSPAGPQDRKMDRKTSIWNPLSYLLVFSNDNKKPQRGTSPCKEWHDVNKSALSEGSTGWQISIANCIPTFKRDVSAWPPSNSSAAVCHLFCFIQFCLQAKKQTTHWLPTSQITAQGDPSPWQGTARKGMFCHVMYTYIQTHICIFITV